MRLATQAFCMGPSKILMPSSPETTRRATPLAVVCAARSRGASWSIIAPPFISAARFEAPLLRLGANRRVGSQIDCRARHRVRTRDGGSVLQEESHRPGLSLLSRVLAWGLPPALKLSHTISDRKGVRRVLYLAYTQVPCHAKSGSCLQRPTLMPCERLP